MIALSSAQLDHIRTLAERAYPEECCGLLIGHDRPGGCVAVIRIVESANVRRDRARDRFEIDPQIRIAVERELRDGPERVVGHYHSHPDHPALPSATDLEMAFEPSLIWLIVGVTAGRAGEINAYRLDTTAVQFEALKLHENMEPNR